MKEDHEEADTNNEIINEFEPHSLLQRMKEDDAAASSSSAAATRLEPQVFDQQLIDNDSIAAATAAQHQQEESSSSIQRRQFVLASIALASQLAATSSFPSPSDAAPLRPSLTELVNYQQSPINKRYGISLSEPERIYPISFITYLSRFLLVFDDECQRWWYTQAQAIPPNSSKEAVESIRLRQFGQFAASVEVGLIDFEGGKDSNNNNGDGPRRLIDSLVRRYGPLSLNTVGGTAGSTASSSSASEDTLSTEATSSASSSSSTTSNTGGAPSSESEILKSKEALRQLALAFSLLKEYQPVDCITRILAADDDAKIDSIIMMDTGAGYPPPSVAMPEVVFPEPPTLGTEFGGSTARGKAMMKKSGRILKVELMNGGRGYINPPVVTIGPPNGNGGKGGGGNELQQATAQAVLGKKKLKGTIERIDILDPGMGYTTLNNNNNNNNNDNTPNGGGEHITVTISPPDDPKVGEPATAKILLEYEIAGISVLDGGSGYAAEKAINIVIDPPPGAARGGSGGRVRSAFAISYPKGKSTSYESFLGSRSVSEVSASLANVDTSQFLTGPTSGQLLKLLPSGFGLQYDESLGRYILSRSTMGNNWEDILGGSLEGQSFKPINPIFGFRGRSPIEKEKNLDISKVARFMASGAICSSIAHFALTPIDVVKTKVQTKPDVYNGGIVGTFQKVLTEEGPATFFDGWEPTFAGYFIAGAIAFFFTEYFRRIFSNLITTVLLASSSAASEVSAAATVSSLEIPLIVASAASSAFLCCFLLAPFDAVRIRTVSQPDYADNIFGVVSRMIEEEGLLSLFSTVPVWFVKEIPFNVMKFLVFDTSTEFMYETFPAAREDIRLSLLVSLFGGTLGGIAATIVSNPADAVISELKKSKTEMSPMEAVEILKERAGIKAFAKGMSLRMIYYSLLVSLQFFLYDSVRIALGVGSDDMKLYLNVLNVALNEKVKQ